MNFENKPKANKMYLGEWNYKPHNSNGGSGAENQNYPAKTTPNVDKKSSQPYKSQERNVEPEIEEEEEKPKYDVRLFDGVFDNGNEPYEFNKPCRVVIKADLPKECKHFKVEFSLYSVYKGKETDQQFRAVGYIDKKGRAEAKLILWYDDKFYEDLDTNSQETVEYFFKAKQRDITVPVESARLIMPRAKDLCVLEWSDVNFGTNRKILLPNHVNEIPNDPKAKSKTGVVAGAAFKKILEYAEENPQKSLLIAGHTDSTGSENNNDILSSDRAKNVLLYISGQTESWAVDSFKQYSPDDLQYILLWASQQFGFNSNPSKIDGIFGSKSKEALNSFRNDFQLHFKTELYSAAELKSDSPTKTDFLAFYALYDDVLAKAMGIDKKELVKKKSSLKLTNPAAIGCGERFTIESAGIDNVSSQKNRRVDFLFFDEKEIPNLKQHPIGILIYGKGMYTMTPLVARSNDNNPPTDNKLFEIYMEFAEGIPANHEEYTLTLGSKNLSGKTDENGKIQFEAPLDIKTGELMFMGAVYKLEFHEEYKGTRVKQAQYRLANLNFLQKELTGEWDAPTKNAVGRFLHQERISTFQLDKLDEDTYNRIVKVHDRLEV